MKAIGLVQYGKELIMDLHDCNTFTFNRKSLDAYFKKLCEAIKMQKCERYFWDDVGVPEKERQLSPHTKGTSAVQFILTSTIVIHTLELLRAVYINIFSCKEFDSKIAERITTEWFEGKVVNKTVIRRI